MKTKDHDADSEKTIVRAKRDIEKPPSDRAFHETEIERVSEAFSYSGPLPVSSELKGYEDVLPGAANRILTMAENEQAHQHRIGAKLTNGVLFNMAIDSSSWFIVSVACIVAATTLVISGDVIEGSAFGTVGAIAVIVQIFSQFNRRKQNE